MFFVIARYVSYHLTQPALIAYFYGLFRTNASVRCTKRFTSERKNMTALVLSQNRVSCRKRKITEPYKRALFERKSDGHKAVTTTSSCCWYFGKSFILSIRTAIGRQAGKRRPFRQESFSTPFFLSSSFVLEYVKSFCPYATSVHDTILLP